MAFLPERRVFGVLFLCEGYIMKLYLREYGKAEEATLIGEIVDIEETIKRKRSLYFERDITDFNYYGIYTFLLKSPYNFNKIIDKELEFWIKDDNNVLWYSIGEIEEVSEGSKKVIIVSKGIPVNRNHERLNLSAE